jgi:hypothetical protein
MDIDLMAGIDKRKALFFLALLTLAAKLLAASLPTLELKPGLPPPEIKNDVVAVTAGNGSFIETIPINRFIIILACLVGAAFFLYSLYRVIRGASWRDVLVLIQLILVIALIMGGLLFVILSMPRGAPPVEQEVFMPTPAPEVTAPLGPVPPILLWTVGAALFIFAILIAVWVYRSMQSKSDAADLIAREAEKARQRILLGVGLKDVIIECYRQMSLVLQEDRGITRTDFMTTLDFEQLLAHAGFPEGPVHDLTQMFNAARYGNWQPSTGDEQKAIQCFESITQFTRVPEDWRQDKNVSA